MYKRLIELECTVWVVCASYNYKPDNDSDCELAERIVDYMRINAGTSSEGLYIKTLVSAEPGSDSRLTFIVSQNLDGRALS